VYSGAPTPISVQVTAPQASLPKGTTEQLTATERFSDGTAKDVTAQVTWSSSNPGAASVGPGGVLSATATGSTTISAAIAGLVGTASISVAAPVAFLVINPPIVLLRSGQTRQLTVTAWLTDGSRLAVTGLVRWGSIFGGAATISPTGLVSANHPIATIVTATLGRSSTIGLVLVTP
jgi:hypothetical protein